MTIHTGDCIEVMATLPEASVDAIVTDPPAGISFMGKGWDHNRGGRDQWVAWMTDVMRGCYRVLKPGGYLLCWAMPRTAHWTGWAIEEAGFEVRDKVIHAFASGFPKSRALLKPAYEDWWMARKPGPLRELDIDGCRIPGQPWQAHDATGLASVKFFTEGDAPVIHKEPHELGRWPANVVLTDPIFDGGIEGVVGGGETTSGKMMPTFVTSGDQRAVYGKDAASGFTTMETYGDTGTYSRFFLIPKASRSDREPVLPGMLEERADVAGAPERSIKRCANCGSARLGEAGVHICRPGCVEKRLVLELAERKTRANVHPTVKPIELMRHLVRLVTPPGGTVLDPFGGSGTTALAAEAEGRDWLLIEREAEYVAIAEARLAGWQRGLGLDVA